MRKKDWRDLARYRALGTPDEIEARLAQLAALEKYIRDYDAQLKKKASADAGTSTDAGSHT